MDTKLSTSKSRDFDLAFRVYSNRKIRPIFLFFIKFVFLPHRSKRVGTPLRPLRKSTAPPPQRPPPSTELPEQLSDDPACVTLPSQQLPNIFISRFKAWSEKLLVNRTVAWHFVKNHCKVRSNSGVTRDPNSAGLLCNYYVLSFVLRTTRTYKIGLHFRQMERKYQWYQ